MNWQSRFIEVNASLERRGMMPDRPPGLQLTREGLEALGFWQWPWMKHFAGDPRRSVIVAGTNGKGSVCATLEALFRDAGERTGLYSSPHLIDARERFRIGGQDISYEMFCRAFEAVARKSEKLPLSHFEMLTLMAAYIFCSGALCEPVQRLILEVGLGGTWDATNALPHGLCVMTSLALDHQNLLGPTLAEIAANKFGVVHLHGRVVHAPLPSETLAAARATQKKTQSEWSEAPQARCEMRTPFDVHPGAEAPETWIHGAWGSAPLALAGERAVENTALALAAFEAAGFDPRPHLGALKNVRWPGRMDLLGRTAAGVPIYVSGDHNPAGARSLLALLRHYPRKRLFLLVGLSADKDHEALLSTLSDIPNGEITLTQSPYRGRALKDFGPWLQRAAAIEDSRQALAALCGRAREGDMILITGSLYLAGAFYHMRRDQKLPR